MKRSNLTSQSGATLVEFAVAALFFFGTIGFICDMGVGLFRYSLLNQAAIVATRKLATSFAQTASSANLSTTRCQDYLDFIQTDTQYGIDLRDFVEQQHSIYGDFQLSPQIRRSSSGTNNYLISVEGTWKFSCLLCIYLPQQAFTLRASADALVETNSFYCS